MFKRLTGSFKWKLTLSFLIVNLVTLVVLFAFSSYYFTETAKREFHRSSTVIVDSLNSQMDIYLKYMERSAIPFISDPNLQQLLNQTEPLTYQQTDEVEKMLQRQLALQFAEISGMFLLKEDDPNHILTTYGPYYSDANFYKQEPWLIHPMDDRIAIYPTHTPHYPQGQQSQVLSLVIPIHDRVKAGLIGHLVIDFLPTEIAQKVSEVPLGDRGVIFVVSDQDTIVYDENPTLLGVPRSQTFLRNININTNEQASIQQNAGEKWIVSSSHSPQTGWIVVSMIPFAEMAQEMKAARLATLLALLILQLFTSLAIPYLAHRFTGPIAGLIQSMRQVARGDFSTRAKVPERKDEVRILIENYNTMVGRLDHLMNTVMHMELQEMKLQLSQKEAIIRALQNQINPHLLYNSLELIRSTAQFNQVEHTETIARNLAGMYRYNAKFSMEEVTLKDELDHLIRYLEIVKIRFPVFFSSQLLINPKYEDCCCIRLVLQPIVENAVKYAIEPKEGDGRIVVNAFREEDVLTVEIADNGPGFGEDELHRVTQSLEKVTRDISSYQADDALGLLNVHARLVLKYGPEYGIRIHSFQNRGTVVSLRIPFRRIEKRFSGSNNER
jgi:two-component system sensor histidine kinase YesM